MAIDGCAQFDDDVCAYVTCSSKHLLSVTFTIYRPPSTCVRSKAATIIQHMITGM